MRTFGRGFLAGLVVPGVCAFLIFAGTYRLGCTPLPQFGAAGAPLSLNVYDPELFTRLPHDAGDTIVIGSSEMNVAGDGVGDTLMRHIGRCAARPQRVTYLTTEGSAILRGALVLERLRGRRVAAHFVIVANSHYATVGGAVAPALASYFPSPTAVRYHALRYPDSPLFVLPAFHADAAMSDGAPLLWLELRMYREYLGTLLRPIKISLYTTLYPVPERRTAPAPGASEMDPAWGVARAVVPPERLHAELRRQKTVSELQAARDEFYAASLALLAENFRQTGARLTLFDLPLHDRFYERLGLDPVRIEARRRALTDEILGSVPRLRIERAAFQAGEYYDSIHYVDAGRRRLAGEICDRLD